SRRLTQGISISDPNDQFEQAAEKAARRIATGQTISPTGAVSPPPRRSAPTGSPTPQTVVVQRFEIAALPQDFDKLGDKQQQLGVFRQYLIALRMTLWEISTLIPKDDQDRLDEARSLAKQVRVLITEQSGKGNQGPTAEITPDDQSKLQLLIQQV